MRFHFVCYSNDKFYETQKLLCSEIRSSFEFDSITSYTEEWLKTTEFYSCNKFLLSEKRGAGWWAWKPYIILKKLEEVEDGDVVVYLDTADTIRPGITSYLRNILDNEICLLLLGGGKNSVWTKKECFVVMKCDESRFWSAPQIEAGFQVWKKCSKTIEILHQYLEWCCNRVAVTDTIYFCDNFPEFVDHRHDQSILTNLAIVYDLPSDGHGSKYFGARNFVKCNVRG